MSDASLRAWKISATDPAEGVFPEAVQPGPLVVSFWLRLARIESARRAIFGIPGFALVCRGERLGVCFDGDVDAEGRVIVAPTRTVTLRGDAWVHIALVGRDDSTSIVINGVEDLALPRPLPSPAPGMPWAFQRRSEGAPPDALEATIALAAWSTKPASVRDVALSLFSESAPTGLTPFVPRVASETTADDLPARSRGAAGWPALAFDAQGGAVRFDRPFAPFEAPESLTVEAWIRPAGRRDPWQSPVVSQHGYGSGWELRASGVAVEFMVTVGGRHVSCGAPFDSSDRWIHLVAVWNRQKAHIYVNGVRLATVDAFGTISGAPVALTLGRNDTFGDRRQFEGAIGEVRVWGVALEADEVLATTFVGGHRRPGLLGAFTMRDAEANRAVVGVDANGDELPTRGAFDRVTVTAAADAPDLALEDAPRARFVEPPNPELERQRAQMLIDAEVDRERTRLTAEYDAQRAALEERVRRTERERDEARAARTALEARVAAAPPAPPPAAPAGSYSLHGLIRTMNQQIESARANLKGTGGPQLGRVSLDLRVVPDGEFFRFPKLIQDDGQPAPTQIAAGNLSTLSLEFEDARASEPKAPELRKMVDVRGYTEVMATRLLAAVGLTLEANFQAVTSERDEGRVVRQWPSPGVDVPVGTKALVFVGKLAQR